MMRTIQRSAFVLALAIWGLSPVSARAVEIQRDQTFESVVQASLKDPKRGFAVKIGAEWCAPCRMEEDYLSKLPKDDKSAINQSLWTFIHSDNQPEEKQAAIRAAVAAGFRVGGGIPVNMVLKGGKVVFAMTGFDPRAMENALSENPTKKESVAEAFKRPIESPKKPAEESAELSVDDAFDALMKQIYAEKGSATAVARYLNERFKKSEYDLKVSTPEADKARAGAVDSLFR